MGTKERIEILNKKDTVINQLLERISNLEFEVERLNNIINKYVEDMENYLESNPPVDMQDYTHTVSDIEFLEKNIEGLKFITTIRTKLQELKGSDKE